MKNCSICGMETENNKNICDKCLSENLDLHEAFTHKFIKKDYVSISYDDNYVYLYLRKRDKFYIGSIKDVRPEELYKLMKLTRKDESVGNPVYTNLDVGDLAKYVKRTMKRL